MGLGLLASAFAPWVAVLTLLRFSDLGVWGWVALGACAVALLLLGLVLRGLGAVQSRPVESKTVKRADERLLPFVSSNLVPILIATYGAASPATIVATAAVVAFMATVYVRAGLYHLNPTLALLGYRVYEVTATNGVVTMLLSRRSHLPQTGTLTCRYLGDDVAIQLTGDA